MILRVSFAVIFATAFFLGDFSFEKNAFTLFTRGYTPVSEIYFYYYKLPQLPQVSALYLHPVFGIWGYALACFPNFIWLLYFICIVGVLLRGRHSLPFLILSAMLPLGGFLFLPGVLIYALGEYLLSQKRKLFLIIFSILPVAYPPGFVLYYFWYRKGKIPGILLLVLLLVWFTFFSLLADAGYALPLYSDWYMILSHMKQIHIIFLETFRLEKSFPGLLLILGMFAQSILAWKKNLRIQHKTDIFLMLLCYFTLTPVSGHVFLLTAFFFYFTNNCNSRPVDPTPESILPNLKRPAAEFFLAGIFTSVFFFLVENAMNREVYPECENATVVISPRVLQSPLGLRRITSSHPDKIIISELDVMERNVHALLSDLAGAGRVFSIAALKYLTAEKQKAMQEEAIFRMLPKIVLVAGGGTTEGNTRNPTRAWRLNQELTQMGINVTILQPM